MNTPHPLNGPSEVPTVPHGAPPGLSLTTIPGYEVLREIGRGGMGLVYEAVQLAAGRPVALKVILAGRLAGPAERARFRTEIDVAGHLDHPHIVPIYDVGEHDGLPFFAMKLIAGAPLSQWFKLHQAARAAATRSDRPLHDRQAVALLAKVTRAVAHAHQHGVLHRDLKPGNVLVDGDDQPHVTDFGLAKRLTGDGETLTNTGAVLGTPGYIAPEQARGEKGLTTAADVYALGAMLYHWLVGRPAFVSHHTMDALVKVLHEEPDRPRSLDPTADRDLETICLKAMHREPARRYASAAELADDLERWLRGEPIRARPAGTWERARKWARRHPALATLAATIALLLVTATAGSLAFAARLQAERDAARHAQAVAEAAEASRREQLYRSSLAEANAWRTSRRPGQRFEGLAAVRRALALLDQLGLTPEDRAREIDKLRTTAIACLALPDIEPVRRWSPWPSLAAYEFANTLDRYAASEKSGRVVIRRLSDDAELAAWQDGAMPWGAYFVPGGPLVLLSRERHVALWDTATGSTRRWRLPATPLSLSISPRGRLLATLDLDGAVRLFTLPDGRPGPTFRVAPFVGLPRERAPFLAFSPDESRLATAGGNYSDTARRLLHVFPTDGRGPPVTFPHDDTVYSASWYPDSRTLAVGTWNDNDVFIWDVVSRRRLETITRHKGGASTVSVNSPGDVITSFSWWARSLSVWHAHTGQEMLRIASAAPAIHGQAALDGRLYGLLNAGRDETLYALVPGHERRLLVRHVGGAKAKKPGQVALHPGGRLLAIGQEDGVGLWDLDTGRDLGLLPVGHTLRLTFETSGDLLTYGESGLHRWPVRPGTTAWSIGPPATVLNRRSAGNLALAVSRDDRFILLANRFQGALLLDRQRPGRPLPLRPHPDTRDVALSPDGRFAVSGAYGAGGGVKVWDTSSGALIKTLWEGSPSSALAFDPPGRHLIAGGRWFEVGTWREVPGVDGWALGCLSRDGRWLARQGPPGLLQLYSATDRKLVAEFADPDQGFGDFQAFSHDGTRLIATDNGNQIVQVWDLRLIRRQLAEMGLDWAGPAYPPAPPVTRPPEALSLRIELGPTGARPLTRALAQQLAAGMAASVTLQPLNALAWYELGLNLYRTRNDAEAIQALELAQLLAPGHGPTRQLLATACNSIAWQDGVTAPADRRDPHRALPLARRAVALASRERVALYRNTLGAVLYRAGRPREALAAFEANRAAGQLQGAFDLFFIALCRHRLGEVAAAREAYDEARAWWQKQANLDASDVAELRAFEAEARALFPPQ